MEFKTSSSSAMKNQSGMMQFEYLCALCSWIFVRCLPHNLHLANEKQFGSMKKSSVVVFVLVAVVANLFLFTIAVVA